MLGDGCPVHTAANISSRVHNLKRLRDTRPPCPRPRARLGRGVVVYEVCCAVRCHLLLSVSHQCRHHWSHLVRDISHPQALHSSDHRGLWQPPVGNVRCSTAEAGTPMMKCRSEPVGATSGGVPSRHRPNEKPQPMPTALSLHQFVSSARSASPSGGSWATTCSRALGCLGNKINPWRSAGFRTTRDRLSIWHINNRQKGPSDLPWSHDGKLTLSELIR